MKHRQMAALELGSNLELSNMRCPTMPTQSYPHTYCHYSEYCCSAPMRAAVVRTPPPPPGGGKNKEGYVPQLSSLYIIPARRDAIRLRSVKPM